MKIPSCLFFQLFDLCMPNFGLLNFNYSVLATAAINPTEGERISLDVSGYTWDQVARCVRWMSAFAFAIREPSPIQIKNFHGEAPEDAHHLQNYVVDLAVLERATTRLAALADMRLRNVQDPSAQRAALPTGVIQTPDEQEVNVLFFADKLTARRTLVATLWPHCRPAVPSFAR